MFRLRLGLVLSLTLLFAGCVASQTNTTTSGVEGQVRVGPMCPVAQAGVLCPDQPFQATLVVLDQNRRPVTQIRSDLDGHFKVDLAPGTYVLSPAPADAVARAPEQIVDVAAGEFLRVLITYDNGIR